MKVLYKLLGRLTGMLSGMLAGAIFRRGWKIAAREDKAPEATDARRGWREVLLAALEGAIYSMVKATVDRGTAASARTLSGASPEDQKTSSRR